MNRLVFQASEPSSDDASKLETAAFDGLQFEPSDEARLLDCGRISGEEQLCLFSPLHYEDGYAYPLLIWLHDQGGDQRQLHQVMPHISIRNYVGVGLRGDNLRSLSRDGIEGSFSPEQCNWQQSLSGIDYALDAACEAIDVASNRFHIASHRVFLVGFRDGGTMAVRLALQNPGTFAGAVSLCGPMPTNHRPLRLINACRQTPLMLTTGDASTLYPAADVCRDLRAAHTAGLSVSFRQYPGDDHLSTKMLGDVDRWLMERVVPTPC